MNNIAKTLLVLGVLAGASACGGDDGDTKKQVDGGTGITPVTRVDGGMNNLDGGAGNLDSGTTTTPGNDGGTTVTNPGDCFTGTPTKQADFLNRCTNAQTTAKTQLGIPSGLLDAQGNVLPL